MAKRDQLQKDIEQMQEVYNDASTPADVKETLKTAIDQAKQQLAALPAEKPAPASSKKKAVKAAKPVKKAAVKKAVSLADCKEIVAKYTQSQKKEKQRLNKRKKQGKPAKLTVPETLKKTAKVVKIKVEETEDKGKKITRAQQDSAIDQIVEIAGAILDGLQPSEYTAFIDRLNKAIREHLTKSGKKAAHGYSIGGDDLPSIGAGVTQSGNMRIGSYRTQHFDVSPDAQKLFDDLLKASEGDTAAYVLTSTAARELDEILAIVKEVQVAERCTRLEYTNAISRAMLFMYWLGKLFDKLPYDDNINRFYPRFLPGYLYFLANKLPEDETPEMAAFGKRLKSAIMRDRAYQSDEEWEQNYERAGSPKHPKYAADGTSLDGDDKPRRRIDIKVVKEQKPQKIKGYSEAEIELIKAKGYDKAYKILSHEDAFARHKKGRYAYVLGLNDDTETIIDMPSDWQRYLNDRNYAFGVERREKVYTMPVEFARGGKIKINKEYKYFVYNPITKKVVAGNEYEEDANDVWDEIKGAKPDTKMKVYSAAFLKRKGIDPYDSANWSNIAFLGMTLINSIDNTLVANSQAGVI